MIESTKSPFKEWSADISDAIRSGEASIAIFGALHEIAAEEGLDSRTIASATNYEALNELLAKGKSGYAADDVTAAFSWLDFRVKIRSCGVMTVTEKLSRSEHLEERVPTLVEELKEAGDELRAKHDDEVIDDVIESVEQLESEDADVTAELLRTMTGR